eukprot:gene19686-6855_t
MTRLHISSFALTRQQERERGEALTSARNTKRKGRGDRLNRSTNRVNTMLGKRGFIWNKHNLILDASRKLRRFQASYATSSGRSPAAPPAVSNLPAPTLKSLSQTSLISFAALGSCAMVHCLLFNTPLATIGGMGATTALVAGAPALPVSQPRNAIGGHLVSAFSGILVSKSLVQTNAFSKLFGIDIT